MKAAEVTTRMKAMAKRPRMKKILMWGVAIFLKDGILKSGQAEAERVFVLEPKSFTPEKKEKVRESRVDFKLK